MPTSYDTEEVLDRLRSIWIAAKIETDRAKALALLADFKVRLRKDPELREWATSRYRVPSC